MVNRIVLVGRMTRDPESKYTQSGIAIATFGIAVNRFTKDEHTGEYEVDFFDVVAWRRTAEFIGEYGAKGRLISVDGRLLTRKWTAQDGTARKTYEIHADNIQTLDKPKERGEHADPDAEGTGEGQDVWADEAENTVTPPAAQTRTPVTQGNRPAQAGRR